MADLIIKPASGSDSLIFQDGAGTAVATISTNNIAFGKGITEPKAVLAATGTVSVNLTLGSYFTCSPTGNITMAFTGLVTGVLNAWTIEFTQDSSTRTVTYPGAVKWGGGAAHVLSTASAAKDIVSFFSIDGGTTIYGAIVGSAFA